MDEHKVVLSADIRKLKQGFKNATVISQNFTKQLEKTKRFTEDAFGNIVPIRQFSGEIAKQNRLYVEQQKILNSISKLKTNKAGIYGLGGKGTLAEGNNYSGNVISFKQATQEMEKTEKVSKNVGNNIDKSFTKGLKSVKRLTIGFLGARSAFSLFRKYLSEYQSQNDEFAQKMQLTTSIITNALAPAFEFFGNVIQYVVIGLARIIKFLTGYDALAKTVDNSMKGASKSTKEFNDNLSGLDEISNISESGGGLSTGIGDQLKSLGDFQDKIAEVDKWFKENPIGKAIKDIATFVGKHPWETLIGIGAFKLATSLLPGFLGVSGGTAGLWGLVLALSLISAKNIIEIVEAWKDLNDLNKENEKTADKQKNDWKELNNGIDEMTEKINGQKVNGAFTNFDIIASQSISDVEKKLKDLNKYSWSAKNIGINVHHGGYVADKKILDDYVESLMVQLRVEAELFKQGKLSTEQQNTFKDRLLEANNQLQKAKEAGYDYKFELKEINDELNNLNNKNVTATVKVEADMSKFREALKRFEGVNLAGIGIGFQNLPSYDVGTNYVPRDQIAMVHEGEAIIPKKYNNSNYLGQLGNSETNELLMELNRSILEFANRPQTLNVNGKELAKVTYGDFQEEGSRRGANTSIRRV